MPSEIIEISTSFLRINFIRFISAILDLV